MIIEDVDYEVAQLILECPGYSRRPVVSWAPDSYQGVGYVP